MFRPVTTLLNKFLNGNFHIKFCVSLGMLHKVLGALADQKSYHYFEYTIEVKEDYKQKGKLDSCKLI